MRPVVRKKPEKPVKNPDAKRELVRVRKIAQQALDEVRIARQYLAKQFAGPEHDALQWAEHALEKIV